MQELIISHLQISGYLLLILAFVHAFFPWYFEWRKDLALMSLINRQMMQIHTLFLAVGLFLLGLLCILSAPELASTALGKRICLGLALFWTLRWMIQFIGYSPLLWRGKRFETTMHIGFVLLWTYLSVVFWVAALNGVKLTDLPDNGQVAVSQPHIE